MSILVRPVLSAAYDILRNTELKSRMYICSEQMYVGNINGEGILNPL